MRCDWPVVPEEDCIEAPCEIFLQLFIQNVEMAVDDSPDDDDDDDDNNDDYDFPFGNGGELNEHDADELIQNFDPILIEDDSFSDDSDDSLASSVPSPCPVTDTELTPSSSDGESESEIHCEESNNDAHSIRNSEHSDEESFEENVLFDESEQQEEFDLFHESEMLELQTDVHPRRGSRCSEMALNSAVFSKSENPAETCHSIVACQESENYCDVISSKDVSLSSGMSHLGESSVESESSSGNSGLQPSTHVSLYVVVPPTNFSTETSSNLLPGVSSDLTGLIPINPPYYPTSFISDNENFQSDNASVKNSTKIPNSFDESTSSGASALPDNTSTEDIQKSSVMDIDSAFDNFDFDSKSETAICFDDRQFGLSDDDTTLSEENGMLEKNESSEMLDKSVSSLKRKVSSVDDNMLNKVPKYSSSQTSNDLVNQASLDYCKVLSNNSERQIPGEEDKIDIVPPAVAADNVILTLGKSVEQTSVVNEKPKSR